MSIYRPSLRGSVASRELPFCYFFRTSATSFWSCASVSSLDIIPLTNVCYRFFVFLFTVHPPFYLSLPFSQGLTTIFHFALSARWFEFQTTGLSIVALLKVRTRVWNEVLDFDISVSTPLRNLSRDFCHAKPKSSIFIVPTSMHYDNPVSSRIHRPTWTKYALLGRRPPSSLAED